LTFYEAVDTPPVMVYAQKTRRKLSKFSTFSSALAPCYRASRFDFFVKVMRV
jgi:hypothetical protein